MQPLSVQKRSLENASIPTTVYRVETRSGVRTFSLPAVERRFSKSSLEIREEGESNDITIRGHAAVFGRKSDDLGGFREIINPGAFKGVLDTDPDVRALLNHDPNYVLGRTKSKTLDLREDQFGLHYFAKPADTQYARDLRTLIKRGDIDQSSFSFSLGPESRERWEESEDGEIVRTILEVDGLYDVSPVTYPAYSQTDVSARDVSPESEESEPEARKATAADAEAEVGDDQEAQKVARLAEAQARARRRLTLAKARSR